MTSLDIQPGTAVTLASPGQTPEQVHIFESQSILAVNAALAARRPLLVRGEPGIGKSQLARAAAKALDRAFVPFVVDARTESRDLLYRFDAVARLAEAQLRGAFQQTDAGIQDRLKVENFVHPGPLWWVFDWEDARRQASAVKTSEPPQADGGNPHNGCVVLIDEIDKAESDVPNGLLEALARGKFTPLGRNEPVRARERMPLVVITTNEERTLPDAFIRRCLVLFLAFPDASADLTDLLVQRGRAHFLRPTAKSCRRPRSCSSSTGKRPNASISAPCQAKPNTWTWSAPSWAWAAMTCNARRKSCTS